MVSTVDSGSLSSTSCENDDDDDLGVVRDLELDSKKNVRFADDCGGCLETIRIIPEPSDYPPLISPAVLRRYRKAAFDTSSSASSSSSIGENDDDDDIGDKRPRSTWKMSFKQPASEYVKFRETLEQQKVALENVMIKNDIGRMMGTIKVNFFAFNFNEKFR